MRPRARFEANWAYMVMTSLPSPLKLGSPSCWSRQLVTASVTSKSARGAPHGLPHLLALLDFIEISAQIVRTRRRVVYRLLAWRPSLPNLFFPGLGSW
jgi:hypothetical protein